MRTISHPDAVGQLGGGDIYVDGRGNLALATEHEDVRQRVVERLRFWLGEWFLAVNDGVPYYEEIFQRPVSSGVVSRILVEHIRTVEGVTGVSDAQATIDPATRRLQFSATVATNFGSVEVTT